MQYDKITKDFSELKTIVSNPEKLSSSLTDVMHKFKVNSHFGLFDCLKSKGLAISSLLSILLIMPFYSVASIYALFKSGINNDTFNGKKDAYYDVKNNELIDWRKLLLLHAKRFMYLVKRNINLQNNGITALIVDDTVIEKTGKKIEKVGIVNDHVTGRFVLGFKLLVCGFWDGASFIPLDFSIHREKGSKQEKLKAEYKKASNWLSKAKTMKEKSMQTLTRQTERLEKAKQDFANLPNKTRQAKLAQTVQSHQKAHQKYHVAQAQLSECEELVSKLKQRIKQYYAKQKLFGLTSQERREQHKKAIAASSYGHTRRKEADMDKITSMINMLKRVVKNGFIADYVLTDSWFFCQRLLVCLEDLKGGAIKLLTMVKINNQVFTDCKGRQMSVKIIPQLYRKEISECRKLKAQYIRVSCLYHGIRVNLFFVKMRKSTKWHLLLTTDLNLGFIKLMEIYQIRWSIEVFFKEGKQYLNLADCKSSNFDAQIADISLSMLQHILLSYFKRINYMQSMGELFKEISHEMVELDLVTRLLEIFWELVELLCNTAGIDFLEFQEIAFKNEKVLTKFIKLIPQKTLEKAA